MRWPRALQLLVAPTWLLGILVLALAPGRALAQENGDCFTCHTDKDLKQERHGRLVSLFVDEARFAAGVHGKQACIGCHADLKGSEFPHAESLKPPTCAGCHDREVSDHAAGLHGRAEARGDAVAPKCVDCHGKAHGIVPVRDPRSPVTPAKIPFLCGKCHHEGSAVSREFDIPQDRIFENYSESIHGEALLKKGLTVTATCVSCHTPHLVLPHTDARSSIARKNIASTCTKCHSAIEQVHRKIIRGELWEKEAKVLPSCPDCHQPHKVRKVFYEQGMADQDCLVCHAKPDIKATDGRSLYVDASELAQSRHNTRRCSQCHSEVRPSLQRACAAITKKVDCGACHADQVQQYGTSIHGQLQGKGDTNAPSCRECHGTHGTKGRKDPDSPTFSRNVPQLCARCHREGERAAIRYTGTQRDIIEHYSESIHGKGLLKSGLLVTAMCTDCHTAHAILPSADPDSSVNSAHLPDTCGRCHHGIEESFSKSIHSVKVSHSKKPLPVCEDCHTAHTIRRADTLGFKLAITNTCGKCHEDVTKSYFDTYHGKVSQLGYAKTAKCYDCHGAHDILPPSDPRSHLSREHVVGTCQKCHPGAGRRFAGYLTHATHHDPAKYPWLFWTFWGMTGLLIGTFVLGGAHTLMWLPRAIQMRREFRGEEVTADTKALQYVRFSRVNRVLHIAMIVSFMSLALTGLTLKFSYSSWAVALARLLGGFETAGYIHRAAACLMFGIFATHIWDVLRNKKREGLTWKRLLLGPATMVPTWKDAKDLWHSVKWFLGLGPRPKYGRWTYWEKFDYFAVFWGITVIGSTGLMLWFPEFFTRLLPGWLINVATIIHSDEALLAVGFIFTVHFFNTHLRPEKFPMDIVVFTGRMPVEEFKRDKPAEYEALVASGELDQYLREPYQSVVIKAVRFFGWAALTVGFAIVVWIIYAMLFAYR